MAISNKFGDYNANQYDFIPFISLQKNNEIKIISSNFFGEIYSDINSEYKKRSNIKIEFEDDTLKKGSCILKFIVLKGNNNANDPDGRLCYIAKAKKGHLFSGSNTQKVELGIKKYGDTIFITFTRATMKTIDSLNFYFKDNIEDWDDFKGDVKGEWLNCGTVTIVNSLFEKIYNHYPKPYVNKPCDGQYTNQCAIRMSMAIIGANISLKDIKNKSNPGGQTYCKHGHVLGAYNLSEYLNDSKIFGIGITYNGTLQDVRTLLKNKTGILFFENFIEENNNGQQSRSNEFRHIEVWNGQDLISGYDDQMFDATLIKYWKID